MSDSARTRGSDRSDPRPTIVMIVVITGLLVVYFGLLGWRGVGLVAEGSPAAVGLGVGVLLLPLIGAWSVWATLRAGFAHQRLARRIHDEGLELDVSDLPRRPSGRLEREAADQLFARVKAEWEAAPDDWRTSFRVAKAYDYAGDRRRAREAMKRAVQLEEAERRAPS